MICEDEVSAWRSALPAGFLEKSTLHPAELLFGLWRHLLAESAAICDSITNSAVFEPWRHVETASRSQVVAEVCVCVNQAVDRRRAVKDSKEEWYAVDGIRLSSEDSASRSGVRISNIVEEGRVEYVSVRAPSVSVPGPSNFRVSSGKSKKRTTSRSPVKRRFEIASPPLSSHQHRVVEDLGFSTASDHQHSCKKNHGAVGETEGPLLFSRVDCHSCCYFFSNFETALYRLLCCCLPSHAV